MVPDERVGTFVDEAIICPEALSEVVGSPKTVTEMKDHFASDEPIFANRQAAVELAVTDPLERCDHLVIREGSVDTVLDFPDQGMQDAQLLVVKIWVQSHVNFSCGNAGLAC
jgi:hypothetical protein